LFVEICILTFSQYAYYFFIILNQLKSPEFSS
jgi:hypothetical protein